MNIWCVLKLFFNIHTNSCDKVEMSRGKEIHVFLKYLGGSRVFMKWIDVAYMHIYICPHLCYMVHQKNEIHVSRGAHKNSVWESKTWYLSKLWHVGHPAGSFLKNFRHLKLNESLVRNCLDKFRTVCIPQ